MELLICLLKLWLYFFAGNMVHPDKRKGMVYVYQADDQLTHFCWKDRTSGVVEDVSCLGGSNFGCTQMIIIT